MAQQQVKTEDTSEYLTELRTEFGQVEQHLIHTNRILEAEIDRVLKGGDSTKLIEIHRNAPMKLTAKLLIPVKEFPKVNFVGKLIGPGGANMKRLQHELMVRLAVYGRGSMRDKKKEEELRKEGGKKYGHLNEDLHVHLEVQAPPDEAYQRMGRAISAVKPYFDPNFEDQPQMDQGDVYSNGAPHPQAPRSAPPPLGRGAPPRSAPPSGAAPRGPPSRGAHQPGGRGAPRGRAAPQAPPARAAPVEDDYYGGGAASHGRSSYGQYETDAGYEQDAYSRAPPARDPYARSAPANDVQSFDYGHGSSAADQYEAPAKDTWERRDPYARPPAPRGRSNAEYRSHPYGGQESRGRQPAPRY